jgi:Bacterial type II secretion system protein G.
MDQFAADKGRLPQSLDELATEGYMREVPVDPFTNQKDWAITTGEDPNSTDGPIGNDGHPQQLGRGFHRRHPVQRVVEHCRFSIGNCRLVFQ